MNWYWFSLFFLITNAQNQLQFIIILLLLPTLSSGFAAQLIIPGWSDGLGDGWSGGWSDGYIDGRSDGWSAGWLVKALKHIGKPSEPTSTALT
jgi:hypothetical protein